MIKREGDKFYFEGKLLAELYNNKAVIHRTHEHFYIKLGGFCYNRQLLELLDNLKDDEVNYEITIITIYHGKTGEEVYKITPKRALEIGTSVMHNDYEEQICISKNQFDEILKLDKEDETTQVTLEEI